MGDLSRLVFLTRSTTIDSLVSGDFDSSSQAYEVGLIRSLSNVANLSVHCVGLLGTRYQPFQRLLNESLSYTAHGRLTLLTLRSLMSTIIRKEKGKNIALLTTGYYPLEMLVLLLARMVGVRSYSVVFDTHLTATAKMKRFKRLLVNSYFAFGWLLLKRLDGLIVLNEEFVKNSNFTNRVFKTRIGNLFAPRSDVAQRNESDGSLARGLNFLFAGTMNDDNGVGIILSALHKIKHEAVNFSFYGDGDAIEQVIEASAHDMRIKYFGRVSDAELDERILCSDFLICLRDPECLASSYSFPSKLIKFMGSGVPVIANKFPGLDDLCAENLITISSYSAAALADSIAHLARREGDCQIGASARRYVECHNDWGNIAGEMTNFLFQHHARK